jgi:hypothetical protein
MYKNISLFFLFLMTSCQFFDAKAPDENALLEEELKKINWSEVDQYPSIFQCDTFQDVLAQKQCFFDNLIQIIQERIGVDTIQIMYPEVDTIDVKVTINADSTLKFEAQQPKDSIAYDFVKIDSILKNRLSDFPKVEPAIKRGIKVKTQFVVPVIIKVTE